MKAEIQRIKAELRHMSSVQESEPKSDGMQEFEKWERSTIDRLYRDSEHRRPE